MTRRQYHRIVTRIRGRKRRWWDVRSRLDNEMMNPDGLKAQCDQCGACCRQLLILIEFNDCEREPKLIRNVIALPIVQASMERVVGPNGEKDDVVSVLVPASNDPEHLQLANATPCPMLAGNVCSINATKPGLCRHSPAGGFCCQHSRQKEGLPALPLIGSRRR